MSDDATGFDPGRFLTKLQGRDYLEVKWRLVWLRQRHPDAAIDTTMVVNEPDEAVFKATVSVPGGGSASGWGSETAGDFRDFREKAETKALGRALAALGFGTQFCEDFDFGGGGERVVDAPVSRPAQQRSQPRPAPRANALPDGPGNGPAPESWQTFWAWARPNGFQRLEQIQSVLPEVKVHELTPGQLRAAVEAFLAEVTATS